MSEEITQTKICSKCKIEKHIKMFHKDSVKKDRLRPQCKECIVLYSKKVKEKTNKQMLEYYQRNKEKFAKYGKDYYRNNKNKIDEYNKKYHKTISYKASKKNSGHIRRSATKSGDVTSEQIIELEQKAKICYWCRININTNNIHIDHYYPLSRGGKHTIDNLVVSCIKCNLEKHAKDPIAFANSIGRLL